MGKVRATMAHLRPPPRTAHAHGKATGSPAGGAGVGAGAGAGAGAAGGGGSGGSGARPFDCILMDFVMPVMDGPTATYEIRALGFTAPIFGVTGNCLDFDIKRFKDCGATEVFPKPFLVEQFEFAMLTAAAAVHVQSQSNSSNISNTSSNSNMQTGNIRMSNRSLLDAAVNIRGALGVGGGASKGNSWRLKHSQPQSQSSSQPQSLPLSQQQSQQQSQKSLLSQLPQKQPQQSQQSPQQQPQQQQQQRQTSGKQTIMGMPKLW